jgi:hypothetical protein
MRWSSLSSRRRSIGAAIACVLGAGIVYLAAHLPAGSGATEILLDIAAPKLTPIRFYWNDWSAVTPLTITTTSDQRAAVRFAAPSEHFYRIRIDPIAGPGQQVRIYGLAIRLANGATVPISLDTLASWNVYQMPRATREADSLIYQTGDGSFLYGDVELPVQSRFHEWSLYLKNVMRIHSFSFGLIVVVSLLAAATVVSLRALIPFAVLMLVVPPAALYYGIAIFRALLPSDRYEVETAVGRAAFFGQSLGPARWATVLATLAALAMAMICGRLAFFSLVPAGGFAATDRQLPRFSRAAWLFPAAWALLLVLLLMPDVGAIARDTLTHTFYQHWDMNNFWAWRGFVGRGDRAFVDFWYPYAGFWMFFLPLPIGPLTEFLHTFLLYLVLGISVWRLCDRRVLPSLAISVGLMVLCLGSVVESAERYLLSVAVALAFAAIDRDQSVFSAGRLWFCLAFGLALWAEPAQLFYAAPAVAFIAVADELRRRPYVPRQILSRAASDAAGPIVLVGLLIVFFAARGELAAVIETNRDLAAARIYGAYPTPIEPVLRYYPAIMISVFAPFIFLFIGTYFLARRSGHPRLAAAIGACGLIGIVIDQKFFLRGPFGGQAFGISVVGAFLTFALLYLSDRRRLAVACACGAIVAAIGMNDDVWRPAYAKVAAAPTRIAGTVGAVTAQDLMREANQGAFALSRFADFPDELGIIDWIKSRGKKSLYVLGDMPIFYLFVSAPPPYQVNIYNSSPIEAQLRMRDWLRKSQPEVVVLDPRAKTFDQVQTVVRIPIVVNEVVLNYAPEIAIGPYWVLTPRGESPLRLDFWRQVYGSTVEFGRLLEQSQSPHWATCPVGAAAGQCIRYLQLRFSNPVMAETTFNLPVRVAAHTFTVSFVRVPGKPEYLVPIDRLWFWLAGESLVTSPQPQPTPGVEQSIVSKMPPRPVLY